MQEQKSLAATFRIYTQPKVLKMLFLGFSSGLPYLLVFSVLTAWTRDVDVDLKTIGFLSWIGITYSVKVFWSPLVDNVRIPLLNSLLGKRRSWILFAQLMVALSLLGMASVDPLANTSALVMFAISMAIFSATQDIGIDAYRIESVEEKLLGAVTAVYIFGYRLALLVAGAGSLYIAEFYSWPIAYIVMAALMSVGVITIFIVSEPKTYTDNKVEALQSDLTKKISINLPVWLQNAFAWLLTAIVSPFVEFFKRNGWLSLLILGLIAIYRLSDITMGVMAYPFYLDMGFTKIEIANISKIYGFVMTIAGAMLGGVLVARYGVIRPLLLGGVLAVVTNLLFVALAYKGHDTYWLTFVISMDNLSGGIGNAVFLAYMATLTNRAYTATQYALMSSIMTLPSKILAGFSGIIVEQTSYVFFFTYAALLGLPAVILIVILIKINVKKMAVES